MKLEGIRLVVIGGHTIFIWGRLEYNICALVCNHNYSLCCEWIYWYSYPSYIRPYFYHLCDLRALGVEQPHNSNAAFCRIVQWWLHKQHISNNTMIQHDKKILDDAFDVRKILTYWHKLLSISKFLWTPCFLLKVTLKKLQNFLKWLS